MRRDVQFGLLGLLLVVAAVIVIGSAAGYVHSKVAEAAEAQAEIDRDRYLSSVEQDVDQLRAEYAYVLRRAGSEQASEIECARDVESLQDNPIRLRDYVDQAEEGLGAVNGEEYDLRSEADPEMMKIRVGRIRAMEDATSCLLRTVDAYAGLLKGEDAPTVFFCARRVEHDHLEAVETGDAEHYQLFRLLLSKQEELVEHLIGVLQDSRSFCRSDIGEPWSEEGDL